jgi:predicted SAM-dependent methyltransferase
MDGHLINIGCGSTWHPAWVNLDMRPASPQVRSWDVARGLPFGDAQVQACYASHVLEHLSRPQAKALLSECRRVLRPGGVLRLAVPDLEAIAREYLDALASGVGGDPAARRRHEWMMIELLDQLVRKESGGDMARFLSQASLEDADFISRRIGLEREACRQQYQQVDPRPLNGHHGHGMRKALQAVKSLGTRLADVRRITNGGRDRLAIWLSALLLGERGKQAMEEGLFRQSGESHRWMYDRLSLAQVLQEAGFTTVSVCTAFESGIDGFESFGLDVVGGKIRKPDSLFMEGKRS